MTTELEKQFFKVFGIEPKNKCGKTLIYPNCLNPDKCGYDNCIYYQIEYPDITAEKLLQMICISSTIYPIAINFRETTDELKEFILDFCIRHSREIDKHQVRSLFEEGE